MEQASPAVRFSDMEIQHPFCARCAGPNTRPRARWCSPRCQRADRYANDPEYRKAIKTSVQQGRCTPEGKIRRAANHQRKLMNPENRRRQSARLVALKAGYSSEQRRLLMLAAPSQQPAARKARHRLSRYGLTAEGWQTIFEQQGAVCGCCKSADPRSRLGWSTDHDHFTGKVRGILCTVCNTAIGALGDCESGLRRALSYVSGFKPGLSAGLVF